VAVSSQREGMPVTETRTASETILEEVTSWPGVEADTEELGELAFKVGERQIGHLHGDSAAHFSFPRQLWSELMEQGRIVQHPVFPDARQGPAARRINDENDVRDVIELLRLNYDRVVARQGLPPDAAA
jgi:Family of unknown function (DUF5519)